MFTYPNLSESQCHCFEEFARLMQQSNKRFNLTRIADTKRIYIRHFADSLEALSQIDNNAQSPMKLADIGSGAGLPGLALAIARPAWHITSIEATAKKCQFQQAAVGQQPGCPCGFRGWWCRT